MADVFEVLSTRGFVSQVTSEEVLKKALSQSIVSFYAGFDPTGSSLHIGHLVPLYAMAHLARAGHRAYALVGGGTASIGDPSGKTEMRKMLSVSQIDEHARSISSQITRFFSVAGAQAEIVNNADWLRSLNYIEFLREVGRHFSVNRMLSFETYKMRLETGLSFIEFNYQLLQSYDYLVLHRDHGVGLQIGGDDQWGNIVAGVDLIRRMDAAEVEGMTFPLVTRADGKKMGKSEKGAIFLDPELCSPYEFFQYWRNVPDQDVEKFLKLYTFLGLDEIARIVDPAGDINSAKERLAWEVTSIIHGSQEADSVRDAARAAFSGGAGNIDAMPSTKLPVGELEAGVSVVELFVRTGLVESRSAARRLIAQGGARINDRKVESIDDAVDVSWLEHGQLIFRAGKKRYHRVVPA